MHFHVRVSGYVHLARSAWAIRLLLSYERLTIVTKVLNMLKNNFRVSFVVCQCIPPSLKKPIYIIAYYTGLLATPKVSGATVCQCIPYECLSDSSAKCPDLGVRSPDFLTKNWSSPLLGTLVTGCSVHPPDFNTPQSEILTPFLFSSLFSSWHISHTL